MEKRIPLAIVVHLARPEDHTADRTELTFTHNISDHGARVVSKRQWQSGEIAEVTSLNDRITLRGSVAYCAKREDGRYDLGLYFNEQEVTWNPYVKHAGPIHDAISKAELILQEIDEPCKDTRREKPVA